MIDLTSDRFVGHRFEGHGSQRLPISIPTSAASIELMATARNGDEISKTLVVPPNFVSVVTIYPRLTKRSYVWAEPKIVKTAVYPVER